VKKCNTPNKRRSGFALRLLYFQQKSENKKDDLSSIIIRRFLMKKLAKK